jgi:outer membrane protein OmpU
MKKILLATTLLAASTGFAAAEVAVSGTARMGIIYDGADFAYSSRVRVIFKMTGETDGGLSFGAEVRNDQIGTGGTANGDSVVFISGAFGTLKMGDISGAGDVLVGQTSGVGYGPNDGLHEIGFLGNEKTAVYYEYSTGALTFGLGAGQVGSDDFSVAAKYAADGYSVAISYEDNGVSNRTSLLGSATFGSATVKAKVADDSLASDMAWSVSLDYGIDALTLTAVYTDFTANNTVAGLGASYDLGGGAKIKGAVLSLDNGVTSETVGDVGMTFEF